MLVTLLACTTAAALLLTLPRIDATKAPRLVNDATPILHVRIERPLAIDLQHVQVKIGSTVLERDALRLGDDGALLRIRTPRLEDGDHRVHVRIARAGVLQRTIHARWTLIVDTTPPDGTIVSPKPVGAAGASTYVTARQAVVTRLPMRIAVDADPGSSITITSDADGAPVVELDASDEARRSASFAAPQGLQQLRVAISDEAGNTARIVRSVVVDTTGPTLVVRAPRTITNAVLDLPLTAQDPHGVKLLVRVDGIEQEGLLDADPGASGDGVTNEGVDGDDTTGDAAARIEERLATSRRTRIVLDEALLEGRHALEVVATDSLGHARTLKRTIFVDSTERLSDAAGLRPGARGADVIELHDALVKSGVVTRQALAADARTRTYAEATRSAVTRFQNQRAIDADGVAGSETIAALTLKIVIDRGAKTLTLYRLGGVVKSYGVAVGSPQYPTPAGDFAIQSMQQDPTWTPPDSDWAKDAEPIPPGPDNPLGTRWMAIYGTVGIHGTNNPASIGYSVSHGCIRMRIPDVEELFDQVTIGTPVTVV